MTAFVCTACKQVIPSRYDQFERRIEFRSCNDQSRYRVLLDRLVCRACVDVEVGEQRGSKSAGRQESML